MLRLSAKRFRPFAAHVVMHPGLSVRGGDGDDDHDNDATADDNINENDDDDDDNDNDDNDAEYPRGASDGRSPAPTVGVQVAVPRASRDGILVSFQTLTPAASSRVLENRRARDDARAKAAALWRAAKEAKEAKAKVRALSQVWAARVPRTAVVAPKSLRGWRLRSIDANVCCSARSGTRCMRNLPAFLCLMPCGA